MHDVGDRASLVHMIDAHTIEADPETGAPIGLYMVDIGSAEDFSTTNGVAFVDGKSLTPCNALEARRLLAVWAHATVRRVPEMAMPKTVILAPAAATVSAPLPVEAPPEPAPLPKAPPPLSADQVRAIAAVAPSVSSFDEAMRQVEQELPQTKKRRASTSAE